MALAPPPTAQDAPTESRRQAATWLVQLGSALRRDRRALPALVWMLALSISIAVQAPTAVLHNDIRFSFGALRATRAAGMSALDTFTHRPLLNRVLMDAWERVGTALGGDFERTVQITGLAAAALACALLGHALTSYASSAVALATSLGAYAALAWPSNSFALQPEWVAAVFAVTAVALALARPTFADAGVARRAAAGLQAAAGLLLAAATLQKYVTVTTALLALGVIAAIDARRVLRVALVAAAATAGGFALTLALGSHEWQWFLEMPRLNVSTGVRWSALGRSLLAWAWVSPAILLVPASTILLYRLTRRRIWVVGPVAALVLTLPMIVLQNTFWTYQFMPLSVLATALLGCAALRWWETTRTVPWALMLAPAWLIVTAALGSTTFEWRFAHTAPVVVAMTLLVASTSFAAARQEVVDTARPGQRWALGALAAGLCLLASYGGWPGTWYGYSYLDLNRVGAVDVRRELSAEAATVGAALGESEVIYFANADAVYFVGLPTSCRYPVDVFVNRSAKLPELEHLRSFREGVECLRDSSVRYLVFQRGFTWSRSPASVRQATEDNFDCAHPIVKTAQLTVCPRR